MIDLLFPLKQEDYFYPEYLRQIFESKIIKSGAVGKDGIRPSTFADNLDYEVELISRNALSETYHFTNFKERLILRGSKRPPRQISIPTIRDRLTLRATCNALSNLSPSSAPEPPHSLIKRIVKLIRSSSEPVSFVRIDVRNFYPSIDHKQLIETLEGEGVGPIVKTLIERAISTPTGNERERAKTGVPQGLSISNILASLYMKRYDADRGNNFFRYVDDVLLVVPSHLTKKQFQSEAGILSAMNLAIHPPGVEGKSRICRVGEGIDYLGYNICPNKVSIRSSSYRRMFANLLRVFTQYRYHPKDDVFILRLNLKITGCIVDGKRRGWLLFFSQTEDVAQLTYLAHFVTVQLKRVKFQASSVHVKRFVKAYHEIRFNSCSGNYITNFDEFTPEQKLDFISKIQGKPIEGLMTLSPASIDREFQVAVSREVQELEKDVVGSIS